MPPKRPQSNFSSRPIRRLRLPKISPLKTKGFFEEYFYVFLGIIFAGAFIFGKAAEMGTYDAAVVGLWVTGFAWFARQIRRYMKERSGPEAEKKPAQAVKPVAQAAKETAAAKLKPMIGPQWAAKTPQRPPQAPLDTTESEQKSKPAFVYERPTLPDRKPKLPHNWRGQRDKKPKR